MDMAGAAIGGCAVRFPADGRIRRGIAPAALSGSVTRAGKA